MNKAKRVKDQHNINFLSENHKLKMKPLEQMSRSEFNTYKEQVRIMTKRGVPRFSYTKINDNVSISRSEEMRLRYNKRIADKQAKERYNAIKDKDFYEAKQKPRKVGTYVETMKDPDIPGIDAPHVQPDEKIASRDYVRSKIKQLEQSTDPHIRKERNEKMKENYIEGLQTKFNNESDDLVNMIDEMDTDDFIELYSRSSDMSFSFFYIDDHDLLTENKNNVQEYVESYYSGEVDMDIKNARNNINTNLK